MSEQSVSTEKLKKVVATLLDDLRRGAGDRDRRRQVEEWMKVLADKYPEFGVERGLREYYLAEAERLSSEFASSEDLAQRLALARSIEGLLEKAGEIERRTSESAQQ